MKIKCNGKGGCGKEKDRKDFYLDAFGRIKKPCKDCERTRKTEQNRAKAKRQNDFFKLLVG